MQGFCRKEVRVAWVLWTGINPSGGGGSGQGHVISLELLNIQQKRVFFPAALSAAIYFFGRSKFKYKNLSKFKLDFFTKTFLNICY